MKYTKKPVTIEAFLWTGGHDQTEDPQWIVDAIKKGDVRVLRKNNPKKVVLAIKTLEGVMTASPGDYIIRGVEGEIYPCKPEIFEKTYQVADDAEEPTLLEIAMLGALCTSEAFCTDEMVEMLRGKGIDSEEDLGDLFVSTLRKKYCIGNDVEATDEQNESLHQDVYGTVTDYIETVVSKMKNYAAE